MEMVKYGIIRIVKNNQYINFVLFSTNLLQSNACSATPSPVTSPKHTCTRPQTIAVQRAKGEVSCQSVQNPNTLHPLGIEFEK